MLFENKHKRNMVSLIAPKDKDSKTMFKWNNNFGWAYTGNITDSSMKENVKLAGGKVDGVLRFSIQWNENGDNNDDYDAYCYEPDGNRIYFSNKGKVHNSSGMLDVDVRYPSRDIAIENIIWTNIGKMKDGVYRLFVNNYDHRGGNSGFRAEVEFDGQIFEFNYNGKIREGENVEVAEVTLKDGKFTMKEKLPSNYSNTTVWSLITNKFVPVSVMMYSPNYWDDQNGIGNKHYMFMLKDCINDESPNGFFNEYLSNELREHRKVFEALWSKMSVEHTEDQLSGLGFSSTKRNELIVKVKGNTQRMLKIKF